VLLASGDGNVSQRLPLLGYRGDSLGAIDDLWIPEIDTTALGSSTFLALCNARRTRDHDPVVLLVEAADPRGPLQLVGDFLVYLGLAIKFKPQVRVEERGTILPIGLDDIDPRDESDEWPPCLVTRRETEWCGQRELVRNRVRLPGKVVRVHPLRSKRIVKDPGHLLNLGAPVAPCLLL